jgi:two-component system, NtrC family, nitrogen regulation sensor histidine kinase GlnL
MSFGQPFCFLFQCSFLAEIFQQSGSDFLDGGLFAGTKPYEGLVAKRGNQRFGCVPTERFRVAHSPFNIYLATASLGNPTLTRKKRFVMGREMTLRVKKLPAPPSLPEFHSDSWEHILASVEEGIIIIDQEEQIAFFNPAAEHLTGFSHSQVWHHPYTEVFASNPWVAEIVQRTLVFGHSRTAGEGEVQSRTRRITPVRLTCSPIFAGGDTRLGLILMLYDLSHQRELAEEVQREDRLAQLGLVAAGLAHEIKNPLAGIRGAAQLLQGRVSSDHSAVEYTAVMIREIDRLSDLLSQLLQLAAGPGLELQQVNVHKVLTEVLLLEREAAPQGVKIITHFDPSLPMVAGDEAQLAQVFRNLIKNALQALIGCRGGMLTISTRMATNFHLVRTEEQGGRRTTRRGRFLALDFADNGPGIPPERFPHLFTPFFTTKSRGTGLGLAISQRIVAQHGGTIRVESTPGQSTLFHVYLPVASA